MMELGLLIRIITILSSSSEYLDTMLLQMAGGDSIILTHIKAML